VVTAVADLRSGDPARIRAALGQPLREPLLIGAVIPLLARSDVLRPVWTRSSRTGPRAAGQLVDAMLDPGTAEGRAPAIPLVLKSCASPLARDGLVQALAAPSLELRLRSGRALLVPRATIPSSPSPRRKPWPRSSASLRAQGATRASCASTSSNLLALALVREPMHIAARACATDDPYLRARLSNTWRRYWRPSLFAALQPRLAGAGEATPRHRPTAEARADLLRAGATMSMSLEE
jgi:hypothetical protein